MKPDCSAWSATMRVVKAAPFSPASSSTCRSRFPRMRLELPSDAVEHVAKQVDVAASELGFYDFTSRAAKRHRSELRGLPGWHECTKTDLAKSVSHLVDVIWHDERREEQVRAELLRQMRAALIEPPTAAQVNTIIRSALHQADERAVAEVAARLARAEGCPRRLDALVFTDLTGDGTAPGDATAVDGDTAEDDEDEVESVLADIKAHPGNVSLNSLLDEISKLGQVRAVGVPEKAFTGIGVQVINACKLPKLPWVSISGKHCNGAIKFTEPEPQKEPKNLRRLKKAIRKKWGTVDLIDILKEAALRTGMLKALAPVGTREAIDEAKLLERLLLIACAYGTNSGISSVAAGEHGHSEEELRYTARRYLTAVGLKAAGVEIANATFAARQEAVWGQGTATVASDSTHFKAWDRDIFTEWHSRYGGRGVLVYWHIEKGSMAIHSQLLNCTGSEVAAAIEARAVSPSSHSRGGSRTRPPPGQGAGTMAAGRSSPSLPGVARPSLSPTAAITIARRSVSAHAHPASSLGCARSCRVEGGACLVGEGHGDQTGLKGRVGARGGCEHEPSLVVAVADGPQLDLLLGPAALVDIPSPTAGAHAAVLLQAGRVA
ncbi:Tn3 family transposase [Streptomyces hirsutus]|uniref:Tn3 family transposase n=1 Tax=Streptomyces hirsutus TaxID=35620 RepID=UPI0006E12290